MLSSPQKILPINKCQKCHLRNPHKAQLQTDWGVGDQGLTNLKINKKFEFILHSVLINLHPFLFYACTVWGKA